MRERGRCLSSLFCPGYKTKTNKTNLSFILNMNSFSAPPSSKAHILLPLKQNDRSSDWRRGANSSSSGERGEREKTFLFLFPFEREFLSEEESFFSNSNPPLIQQKRKRGRERRNAEGWAEERPPVRRAEEERSEVRGLELFFDFLSSLFPPLARFTFSPPRRERSSSAVRPIHELGSSFSLSLSLSSSRRLLSRSYSVLPASKTRKPWSCPRPRRSSTPTSTPSSPASPISMQGNVSATRFCSRPCARRYLNARQGSVSRAIKAMRYVSWFVGGVRSVGAAAVRERRRETEKHQ